MAEDNPTKKLIHVLVLPFTGQGHINPMLQFAKRLVSKGVKPTLVLTTFISKSVTLSNPTTCIDLGTISDGFDDGGLAQAGSPDVYLQTFKSVGSKTLASLISKRSESGQPFDAIIYNSFMPWVLDVAQQFGLLTAAFFTQSCAVNTINFLASKEILRLPIKEPHVHVPGLPLFKASELPSVVYGYGSDPASAWFDMIMNQFSNIDKVDWVLINTFYEFERQVVDWMSKVCRLGAIGPTVPSMYLDKRIEGNRDYGMSLFKPHISTSMNWLSDKPHKSVVYVSFGSYAEVSGEQMEEIAWGLKESHIYFLWAVRESEESKLPNNFKDEEIGEKGLMVGWCPQLEVLANEAVGCFLSHCGYNSVLEAMSLGVPIVAMPQWADQPTNAKLVEDIWGIGIRALPDEKGIVRREVITHCIKELIDGEKGIVIKENANTWKNLARKAVDEGGSSDEKIDEFIATLTS